MGSEAKLSLVSFRRLIVFLTRLCHRLLDRTEHLLYLFRGELIHSPIPQIPKLVDDPEDLSSPLFSKTLPTICIRLACRSCLTHTILLSLV